MKKSITPAHTDTELFNPFIKNEFGGNFTYLMTPKMARFLLNKYEGNIRVESVGGISKLLTSIEHNRFYLTGDCIKFELNTGIVLDGHHRLKAIAQSDKDVMVSVSWGVKREAVLAIDTGIARNAGVCIAASLKQSKEQNPVWRKRATIANMCLRSKNNFRLRDMPDAAAKLAYYNTHSASIDAVMQPGNNIRTNGSGFRGAMALYFQENPIKAQKFYDLVTDNYQHLPYGTPEDTLQKFFNRESRGQGGESTRMKKDFYATRRAVEAYENSQTLLPQHLNSFA